MPYSAASAGCFLRYSSRAAFTSGQSHGQQSNSPIPRPTSPAGTRAQDSPVGALVNEGIPRGASFRLVQAAQEKRVLAPRSTERRLTGCHRVTPRGIELGGRLNTAL